MTRLIALNFFLIISTTVLAYDEADLRDPAYLAALTNGFNNMRSGFLQLTKPVANDKEADPQNTLKNYFLNAYNSAANSNELRAQFYATLSRLAVDDYILQRVREASEAETPELPRFG